MVRDRAVEPITFQDSLYCSSLDETSNPTILNKGNDDSDTKRISGCERTWSAKRRASTRRTGCRAYPGKARESGNAGSAAGVWYLLAGGARGLPKRLQRPKSWCRSKWLPADRAEAAGTGGGDGSAVRAADGSDEAGALATGLAPATVWNPMLPGIKGLSERRMCSFAARAGRLRCRRMKRTLRLRQ